MTIACPACASDATSPFIEAPRDREYHVEHRATVRRCDSCRSLFQHPQPAAEEVRGFYGADYQNYGGSSVPLLARLDAAYQRRQADAFLARHGRAARVLDFGCGQGGFLRAILAAGAEKPAGFDFVLYPELRALAGIRTFDDIDAMAAGGVRFDVIRMRHVIEHLTDHDGTMRRLAGLLAPGGRIVGQTPNGGHHTAGWMRQWWGPLHFPYHTLLYSVAGLKAAAKRWGLQLDGTSGALLPSAWSIGAENLLKALTGSRRRGRTPLYVGLMAAGMPLALLDYALNPRATANFDFTLVAAS